MRNVSKDTANLFDGDIVYTTDNEIIINSIYPNRLPITYDKESAPAQKMTMTNIVKTDLNTFDCKIGQITNYSTKFFSMLCKYDRESREYNELVDRIKLLRRYIGDSIDAGKGIKTKPFPNEWKSWTRVPEDWSDERKSEQWFLNNLVEKKKPYFFIYIYPETMTEYKRAKRLLNDRCKYIFGMSFTELKNKSEKTQEEKNFIRSYYNELPVTKTPCIMNKIAWKVEDLEFDFKYPKNSVDENFDVSKKLMSGNYKIVKSRCEVIKGIYKEWNSWIRMSNNKNYKDILGEDLFDEDDDNYYENIVGKDIFKKRLEELVPNERELADYLVHIAYKMYPDGKMKSFCWTFGYEGIVENLLEKNKKITIPVDDSDGTLYLGRKYRLGEVN